MAHWDPVRRPLRFLHPEPERLTPRTHVGSWRDPGHPSHLNDPLFARIARSTARHTGRASTFILAVVLVLIWAVTGPFFGYSEYWQLVINTGTTIVTFLMIFLLQYSQDRDTKALQTKLDELIRVNHEARNCFLGLENRTAAEQDALREELEALAESQEELRTQAAVLPAPGGGGE